MCAGPGRQENALCAADFTDAGQAVVIDLGTVLFYGLPAIDAPTVLDVETFCRLWCAATPMCQGFVMDQEDGGCYGLREITYDTDAVPPPPGIVFVRIYTDAPTTAPTAAPTLAPILALMCEALADGAMYLYVPDLVAFPGYVGALGAAGMVVVEAMYDEGVNWLRVYYNLTGLPPNTGAGLQLRIHSGFECSQTRVGGPYYNSSAVGLDDPWETEQYTLEPDGTAQGYIDVISGYNDLASNYHHAVVVHDGATSAHAACGTLAACFSSRLGPSGCYVSPLPDTEAPTAVPTSATDAPTAQPTQYGGYVLEHSDDPDDANSDGLEFAAAFNDSHLIGLPIQVFGGVERGIAACADACDASAACGGFVFYAESVFVGKCRLLSHLGGAAAPATTSPSFSFRHVVRTPPTPAPTMAPEPWQQNSSVAFSSVQRAGGPLRRFAAVFDPDARLGLGTEYPYPTTRR